MAAIDNRTVGSFALLSLFDITADHGEKKMRR